jgi:hypothetical protein
LAEVITFEQFTPSPRFDSVAWETARVEEGTSDDGPWTVIDNIALVPVDADPTAPATRDFTTSNGTALDLWYRIIFVDGVANESQPTIPIQNSQGDIIGETPYATVGELFRILKIRAPTAEQTVAGDRVLAAAALEINAELDLAEPLSDPPPALVVGVNLDRAADLWRHTESIAGVTGLLGDEGAIVTPARYSWERYAQRLAPLKEQWGLA